MYRVQYDTYAPDAVIDADAWIQDESGDFVMFEKDGKFAAAVKTMNVLAILPERTTAGPFGGDA